MALSEAQLAAYLRGKLPDAEDIRVSKAERVPGGASRETWSFDASWREGREAVTRGFILRRDPTGGLLETDRDLEFRIYGAIATVGVPVPPMYWLESEGASLERPFFVMGRVSGQTSGAVLMSPTFGDARPAIARQKAEILARIHRAEWRTLGCGEFLGPSPEATTAAAAEIARWEGIMRRDALQPQPVLDVPFRWLKRNRRDAPAITVVHGDYRTGNFLFDETGTSGVLDWEMAHLGDALEGRTNDLILAMTTRMIPGLEREVLTLLERGP